MDMAQSPDVEPAHSVDEKPGKLGSNVKEYDDPPPPARKTLLQSDV
jgi:hypothetical protein